MEATNQMTMGGWVFLIGSLSFVWGLCIWCFWQVLSKGKDIEVPPESLGG